MSELKILSQTPLFADLSKAQLEAIAQRGQERKLVENDVVFAERTAGHELFVLLSGRVQITIEMNRETEQAPVHTVTEGQVFGEFALLTDMDRSATARAVKDSHFFVLSREDFEALAEEDPQLGYRVLRRMTEVLVERVVKTTRELRESLLF